MLTKRMWTNRTQSLLQCLLCAACCVGLSAYAAPSEDSVLRIAKEVRKQIVTLPQYGVFDYIHFAIKGSTVILEGEASRPTLKSAAENVVKKIEGVTNVQNEIEVLPLSPSDDRIRTAVYIRIYRSPTLHR